MRRALSRSASRNQRGASEQPPGCGAKTPHGVLKVTEGSQEPSSENPPTKGIRQGMRVYLGSEGMGLLRLRLSDLAQRKERSMEQ